MKKNALVVGGGPAGLSAAIGLLESGHAVRVLEAQSAWKGRVCGAFLNPDAVRNLAWLGVLDRARRLGAPTPVARLHGPRGASSTVFTAQDGISAMTLSRFDLESLLRDRVARRGGDFSAGMRMTDYGRASGGWRVTVRDAESRERILRTDVLVLADGRFSRAEHRAKPAGGWYGWNATFRNVRQSPGMLEMCFASLGYVGVITFPDGTSNVCGLVRRRRGAGLAWDDVFDFFQRRNRGFAALMTGAERVNEWRGVGPLPYTLRPRREEGILLAGDAAGVGDPFMGEGIGRALGSGPLIAEAHRRCPHSLSQTYAALWSACYGARFRLGWKSRLLLNRPWLTSTVLDPLLRSPLIERATRVFHRGAGFNPAVALR